MTRKRWIQDRVTGELIPAEEFHSRPSQGPFVRGDIAAYQSMVTGEMVEGRAAHREHLKRNNVVEIGDAYDKKLPTPKPIKSPDGLRETIARVAYQKLRY